MLLERVHMACMGKTRKQGGMNLKEMLCLMDVQGKMSRGE